MAIPKEIIDAVLAFRKSVKRMAHDEKNNHDGYAYVSIDKYYEQVASVATGVGLAWKSKEVAYDFVPGMGGRGDRTFVKVTFSYDVMAGGETAEDYGRVTILSPISGAQTAGQLFSYADKVFMRTLGCVATGEKDADANPTEDFTPRNSTPKGVDPILGGGTPPHDPVTGEITDLSLDDEPKKEAAEPNGDVVLKEKDGLPIIDTRKVTAPEVALVEKIFERYLKTIKTKSKLRDWHAENIAAMEKIKTFDPAAYDRIKLAFNTHNKSLAK